jgi:arsenate reductase
MITIYHNPRCRKSRAGLEYLKSKNVEFKTREYLKEPLTEDELKKLMLKLNVSPTEVIRRQEEVYRKNFKNKEFTEDEWITIITENPKLLQRPIVVKENKAVLAQPPEKIDDLI